MKHFKHSMRRAFTLVEIAIALVIIGLMSAVILQSSHVAHPDNCYAATQRQLAEINEAITAYARANGRYPLPSGRSYGVSNPKFGREVASGSADIVSNSGILFGALPFQTLGLNESLAADCWGNKFSYVVTEAMTASGALTTAGLGGSIKVKTGDLGGSTDLLTDAVYGVISHGADGIGGVTKNYSDSSPGWCGAPTTVEMENCNTDDTLFSTVFNNGNQSGPLYFDDLVVFAAALGSNCDAATYPVTWGDTAYNPSGTLCSATPNGPIVSGGMPAVSPVASVIPAPTGSATFICRNGSLVLDTSVAYSCDGCTYPAGGGAPTCGNASCTTAPAYNWGVGGTQPGTPCTGTPDMTTPIADGLTRSFSNTTPGHTGSGTVACSNGTLSWQQGSCDPTPADCSTISMLFTWDNGGSPGLPGPCKIQITPGMLSEGGTQWLNSDPALAPGYSGTGTSRAYVSCNNGVITVIQSPCVPDDPTACPAANLSWGTGCKATFIGVAHGQNSPIGGGTQPSDPALAPGYSGAAIAKCNTGVWSIAWGSCTP